MSAWFLDSELSTCITIDLGCLCFSVWQKLNLGVQQLEHWHFPIIPNLLVHDS